MRLLYDLFACQTGSRLRGIGRFTQSLADAMARLRGEHELIALANGLDLYAVSTDRLRQALSRQLQPAPLMTYTYVERAACDSQTHEALANILVNRTYANLLPDVVMYSTPFEGWGEAGICVLPQVGAEPGAALRVAVLYDFIPWLFPDQYLEPVPAYRQWYAQRLASLPRFDLLLAISESTRNDAIRILGLSAERVVNISGAADAMFRPPAGAAPAISLGHFGIERQFVLYTGNVDYRKNQSGMLQAYAMLPPALRATHQLVLTQVLEHDKFLAEARACGLQANELVITGHVGDDDMLALYSQCALFVFPSLYEGFGLPILEAMACGAAVIAGDNSSIPEVVGRSDVLFDASDPQAIVATMQAVLSDAGWRQSLQRYGIERAKTFTWEKSASVAWQAIEAALQAKRQRQVQRARASLVRPRIAVVCAPPSVSCRAVRHTAALLPLLAAQFEVELYVEEGIWIDTPELEARFQIYPHTRLTAQRDRYAALIYEFDNTRDHAFMLPLSEQFPGIVVLHDWGIDRVVDAHAARTGMPELVTHELLYCHGLQGLIGHSVHGRAYPLNRHLIETAHFLLLAETAALARTGSGSAAGAWLPPWLPLGDTPQSALAAYRQAIDVARPDDTRQTVAALLPLLDPATQPPQLLHALSWHVVNNRRLQQQPRLLFDVTHLARSQARSGIQRVVRSIARALGYDTTLGRPLELVAQAGGRLWRATKVIASIFETERDLAPPAEILAQPGDTLLMIDSSWEQYGDFLPVFQSIRALGGNIVTVVYDLIPLHLPEACSPGLVSAFRTWFRLAAQHSDTLLCISAAVALEVRHYLDAHAMDPHGRLQIRSWPLGADLVVSRRERSVRPAVAALAARAEAAVSRAAGATNAALFLMVGTIEPRKGHDFVLDAFELLWARGIEVRLCIAGTIGWKTAATVSRIKHHPQLRQKLFFVEEFTDAEINLCYGAATALIAASRAEGFGLPIVEAALHQLPTLAADIPVFREVGGDGALYFSLGQPQYLAEAVIEFCHLDHSERVAMAARIQILTWEQSARRLLDVIGVS